MAHENIVLARERGMSRRKEEYGVGGSGRDTSGGLRLLAQQLLLKDTGAHRNPDKKVKPELILMYS